MAEQTALKAVGEEEEQKHKWEEEEFKKIRGPGVEDDLRRRRRRWVG